MADTGGAASVSGTSGNDQIDSSGVATLATGGGGNYTYLYKAGYGALTVNNFDAANNGNEGTIQFGQGITAASLTFSSTGNANADLGITVPGTASGGATGSVTVAGALTPDGLGRIRTLAFAGGGTLAFAAIRDALPTGAPGTATLAGAVQLVQGSTEQDSFLRTGTGALRLAGADANGTAVSSLALTQQGGATFTVDAGTTVVGAGSTFQSPSGAGHTVFLRGSSGTLTVDQFDAAGVLAASQVLTAQGSPVYIDTITSVAGAGQNYFGAGERTLFLHDGDGLVAWGFDAAGAIDAARVLRWSGYGASSVVGSGEDVQGSGPRAVFNYSGGAAGNLSVDLFDAGGTLNQTLVLGTGGRVGGVAVDAGTTVVGGGQDVFGTGGHAAFLRIGAGLSVVEFDGTGAITGSQTLSHQGAAAYIDATTSVVGGGQDFLGNGQRTIFERIGDGTLQALLFDGSGAIGSGMNFVTPQGVRVFVDAMTSIVGAGGDFFRTGEQTLYLRDGNGLVAWGSGPTGVITLGHVLLRGLRQRDDSRGRRGGLLRDRRAHGVRAGIGRQPERAGLRHGVAAGHPAGVHNRGRGGAGDRHGYQGDGRGGRLFRDGGPRHLCAGCHGHAARVGVRRHRGPHGGGMSGPAKNAAFISRGGSGKRRVATVVPGHRRRTGVRGLALTTRSTLFR